MAERLEVYKCEVCGNVVEVLHGGAGELVCCQQPMKLQKANTVDASKEKHVPVVQGNTVKVGSAPHPMEPKHYIEWVELRAGEDSCRRYLKPGDKPEAELCLGGPGAAARIYCNIHGLWKS